MNDGITFFIISFVVIILGSIVLLVCGIVLAFIVSLKGNCVDQATWEDIRNEYYEEEQKRLDEEDRRANEEYLRQLWEDYIFSKSDEVDIWNDNEI